MIKLIACIFLLAIFFTTFIYCIPENEKRYWRYRIKDLAKFIYKKVYDKKYSFTINCLFVVFIITGFVFTKNTRFVFNPFEISDIDVVKNAINFFVYSEAALLAIIASLMFFYYAFVQQRFIRLTPIFLSAVSFFELYIIVIINLVLGLYYVARAGYLNNEIVKSYYYTLLLFIFSLIYIFFFIKNCVNMNYSKTIYLQKIRDIDQFDIDYFEHRRTIADAMDLIYLEGNHVYVLSELILNYIDLNDNINSRIIITEVERKFEYMIKNDIGKQGITERGILNTLTFIYQKALQLAIDKNNITVVYYIMEMSISIHEYCAHKKIERHSYYEYDEYIKHISKIICKIEEKDIALRLFYQLMRMQVLYLSDDCPKETEIFSYYFTNNLPFPDHNLLKESKWEYIERELTWLIMSIGNELINLKQEDLYHSFLYACINQIYEIDNTEISEFQKSLILNSWIYSIKSQLCEAIQRKVFDKASFMSPFNSLSLEKILSKKNNVSINIIATMLTINDCAFENGYHDLGIIDSVFTQLRMCTKELSSDNFFEDILVFLFEYLKKLTMKIDDKKKVLYVQLYEMIDQNRTWLNSAIGASKEHHFLDILNTMNNYKKYKEDLIHQNVEWPTH